MSVNRSTWKKVIYKICKTYEAYKLEHFSQKRALRMKMLTSVRDTFLSVHDCNICNNVVLSKVRLVCHMIANYR